MLSQLAEKEGRAMPSEESLAEIEDEDDDDDDEDDDDDDDE